MKLLLLLSCLLVASIVTSCRVPGEPGETSPEVPEKQVETGTDSDFIGMTAPAAGRLAESRSLRHRIISVDGALRPVTRDYRPDRVNFTIEGGKVTETSRG